MIISIFKKYSSLLFDIAILLAIVFLILVINPWGIFGNGLKLHQTSNQVTAIKQIGELITAEYYGEVISTIGQTRLKTIYEADLNNDANQTFGNIKKELYTLYLNDPEFREPPKNKFLGIFKRREPTKKKTIRKEYYSRCMNNLTNDTLTSPVIEYLWRLNTEKTKKLKKDLKQKHEEAVMMLLLKEIIHKEKTLLKKDFQAYLNGKLPYDSQLFSEFFYDKINAKLKHKEERKELAMIGRGWVKAGINFGTLDDSNFLFDKQEGIVHIFDARVEILNADINPWFIPEKSIPGFEIIQSNNKVDFHDAKLVKQYCIEKLRKQALNAGILSRAEEQAKETMKSFIGLLTNAEIKEVFFHYDAFSVIIKEILNDKFISYSESCTFDSLVAEQLYKMDSLDALRENYDLNQQTRRLMAKRLQAGIASMKQHYFESNSRKYNRLSRITFKIASDEILTPEELNEIKALRINLNEFFNSDFTLSAYDKLWYTDTIGFIPEYNEAINFLEKNIQYYADRTDTSLLSNNQDLLTRLKSQFRTNPGLGKVFEVTDYNNIKAFHYVHNYYSADSLTMLKYPVELNRQWQEELINNSLITLANKNNKLKQYDTVLIDFKILNQFNTFSNTDTTLQFTLFKNTKDYWHVQLPPDSINTEEHAVFDYMININKSYYNRGAITRASDHFKESVNPDSIRYKFALVRENIQYLIKGN